MTLSSGLRRCLKGLRICVALVICAFAAVASPARSHEVTPTIVDFSVSEGRITLQLRMNAEAFVAGMDLDRLANTEESPLSADYDELRELAPAEIEPMVRLFAEDWLNDLSVSANGPVELALETVLIPDVGDTTVPRTSTLRLIGSLPANARSLRISWPTGSGGVVLRQNSVEAPYTGFLKAGQRSVAIPIGGGAVGAPMEVLADYARLGMAHVPARGVEHLLFVLGLFLLSPRLWPLMLQVSLFLAGQSLTLALGAVGAVAVKLAVVEPLVALTIVLVAVENIFVRRLHYWRVVLVVVAGLLHGLALAQPLTHTGLPPGAVSPALVGFSLGVAAVLIAVVAVAYLGVRLWFGRHPKYRGRVAIPASLTIAVVGGYWLVERLVL
ncbi:HupE/UreJ family protein [Leisingera sp.]|uniref:HupE/UreJ family protein n=1 Tax=Leisingera sp. TaxID=1879318 RepID=UPI003A93FB2E